MTHGRRLQANGREELVRNDGMKPIGNALTEFSECGYLADVGRMMPKKKFIAYTDGSNNNRDPRRPAGAAYVILDENGNELHRASKGFLGKTNNEMELLAIISAVNWVPEGASVIVHSDSLYSINVLSGRMAARKNLRLIDLYKHVSRGKDVRFQWVKGHDGNRWNEICDKLANEEYQKLK